MIKFLRNRVPLILAGLYVLIVTACMLFAMFTQDDFGFRFIPVIHATYPLSSLLLKSWDIFFSSLHLAELCLSLCGVVNAGILYALAKILANSLTARHNKLAH